MDYKKYADDLQKAAKYLQERCPNLPDVIATYNKSATVIKTLLAERDAAVEMMSGHCYACKHIASWHNVGPCETCRNESAVFTFAEKGKHTEDNWEWRGLQEKTE